MRTTKTGKLPFRLTLFSVIAFAACALLHAQYLEEPIENSLQPLSMEEVPSSGVAFYLFDHYLQDGSSPPYPFNPHPAANIYWLGGSSYLVDNTLLNSDEEAAAALLMLLQPQDEFSANLFGGGMMMSSQSLEFPPGEGDTNEWSGEGWNPSFTSPTYSTYELWLSIDAVTNGYSVLTLHNTTPGSVYEILSKEALAAELSWFSEGAVAAAEEQDWTQTAVLNDTRTNLFFWARNLSLDSEGGGLPDWWQLEHWGFVGVDPYGDDDNDGWNNLQEFQNNTNPNGFDIPPSITALAQFNPNTSEMVVSWHSAAGPVIGYMVERLDYLSYDFITFYVGLTNQFIDTTAPDFPPIPDSYPGWLIDWVAPPEYYVVAHYNSGTTSEKYSAWVSGYTPDRPAGFCGLNSAGETIAGFYHIPAGATQLRFTRMRSYLSFDQYLFVTNFVVSVSAITNNYYKIPSQYTDIEPLANHWYVEALWPDKPLSKPAYFGASSSPYDARVHLIQNAVFTVRAALLDDAFTYNVGNHVVVMPEYYAYSSTYDLRGYLGSVNSNDEMGTGGSLLNWTHPFFKNYQYRNFVFATTNIDAQGRLNTGCDLSHTLNEPLTFKFSVPTNAGAIPDLLSPTETRWMVPYTVPSDLGMSLSSGVLNLPNNLSNWFGLRLLSVLVAHWNPTNGLFLDVLDAGNSISISNNIYCLYPEFEQPVFQSAGYFFAVSDFYTPVPGSTEFFPENPAKPIIAGVGNPIEVMAAAKKIILNGDTTKPVYIGQVFDRAYKVDSNGNVTATETGILSPHGKFIPTEPGPVALVTMPDLDTGERGTGIVHVVNIQFDRNHDGLMDLTATGPDSFTDPDHPFTFWLNNDYDRGHNVDCVLGNCDFEEDDLGPKEIRGLPVAQRVPDAQYVTNSLPAIPSTRDLEDYARLWIPGLNSLMAVLPTNYTVQLVANYNPLPIRVFRSWESNGGTNYLFDPVTASNQVALSTSLYLGTASWGLPGSGPIVLNGQPNLGEHFIFCAFAPYSGTSFVIFGLEVLDEQGNKILDHTQWIYFQDIKDMYERWTVGERGSYAPANVAQIASEDKHQFRYEPPSDADTPYILHVHGWNMETWEKDRFAETAFKRLYWQGYQGRFGSFRWPTLAQFPSLTGEGTDLNNYDKSEYNAWRSGAALRKLLVDLNGQYPGQVRLSAHSMGNVVAGEALRTNTPLVAVYVAMQAALPAGAYDMAAPFRAIPTIYFDGTTEIYRFYPAFSPTRPYFNFASGAADYVNFYNQSDWALNWWLTDQNLKPNDTLGYSFESSTNTFFQFQGMPSQRILAAPIDTFELFAFSVEGQCWALGAQENVAGVFTTGRQLDLDATFNFADAHKGHSAQFRSSNMRREAFWSTFSTRMGVK